MTSLLPPNATSLERNIEETTSRISSIDLSPVSGLWNPDTCPEHLLSWLAWAEQVDEWSSMWPVTVQRAVIKAHRVVRRKRGTKRAVIDSVAALSGTANVKEWFQYATKKTPHTFDVVITGGGGYIEAELQQSMFRAVDRVKNKRSHYTLGVGLTASCSVGIGGVARVANYRRLSLQG